MEYSINQRCTSYQLLQRIHPAFRVQISRTFYSTKQIFKRIVSLYWKMVNFDHFAVKKLVWDFPYMVCRCRSHISLISDIASVFLPLLPLSQRGANTKRCRLFVVGSSWMLIPFSDCWKKDKWKLLPEILFYLPLTQFWPLFSSFYEHFI